MKIAPLIAAVLYLVFMPADAEQQDGAGLLLFDGAEHGRCIGVPSRDDTGSSDLAFLSTCRADGSGNIVLSDRAAHTGRFGYELPVSVADLPTADYRGPIHVAKMAAHGIPQYLRLGDVVRFRAYFYIADGFDDESWHIQMQWKGMTSHYRGEDRFWVGQNPKISWGFVRHPGSSVREIELSIRDADPSRCERFTFSRFTRGSTLGVEAVPVPSRSWIEVITEILFDDADGYVKIWQSSDVSSTLVVDTGPINTVWQLIHSDIAKETDIYCGTVAGDRLFMSRPTNFTFGLANYLSGSSFAGADTRHVLYIDDISVEKVSGN